MVATPAATAFARPSDCTVLATVTAGPEDIQCTSRLTS